MQRRRFLAGAAAATCFPVVAASRGATQATKDVDEIRSAAVEALPFRRVETTGAEAFDTWRRLKAAGEGWPVVVGDDEDLLQIADIWSQSNGRTPAAILAETARLTYPKSISEFAAQEWDGQLNQVELGTWTRAQKPADSASPLGLSVAHDFEGRAKPRLHILLLPVADGAETFAHLQWGSWNSCPPPEYHVLATRHWARRYGAELVGITGDVLNLRIERPPTTRAEALVLAREQLTYCPDIVLQGTGTLAALASSLISAGWWFFWWD